MSCQLSALSKFQDISAVRRYFFPSSSKEGTPNREPVERTEFGRSDELDNWDQDWGFEEQTGTTTEEDTDVGDANGDEPSHKKWLQTCLISLSPTNDVIVIAREHKICVLTQKWDPKKKGEEIDSNLTPVWESQIGVEEKDTVSAVLCLPLASQKRSTQGGPDWTCIVVGFSSGYVRMYTQTGVLLLSQLLHAEKVERLKCKTYAPPRFLGLAETHDELLIMYTKAVVSIDGFSLIQSLRACCNQVARATASGTENLLQPPPLAYKKWGLGEQQKVSDYVSCGVVCANPFDQLKAASLLGGVKATVKTSPPAMSVFITSGTGPYVGFFYAIEGITQPMLSEVAMAMASKIKSALLSAASGWLGFGGKAKEEKEKPPKIEPATALPLRFGLPDRRRDGEAIMLSPCNNYAATTDSFGRVILIDVNRGMAVRMWKGYRDAEVGWIEVKEENAEPGKNPDHYRLAQFLIIYAPRRGILEVWLAAHGPRVAAFNVSKHCRLFCPCYGMMGLNNVTCRGVKSKTFQCALIDPDGIIKTVDIPFHLALSDKSSKRARDLHQLKKLKAFLKESSDDREGLEETIKELLLDMKVASIAHQAIERVLSTRYLPVQLMQSVVKACIKKLESRVEDNLDLDSRMMLKFCKAQRSLLALYSSVINLNSSKPEPTELPESQIFTDVLRLCSHDAHTALAVLTQHDLLTAVQSKQQSSKVTFQEDVGPLPVTSFLHAFSYRALFSSDDSANNSSMINSPCKQTLQLTVSKEATEERRLALGEFLFAGCLSGRCQASELLSAIQQSGLPPDQLMNLLLLHWLSSNKRNVNTLVSMYELVNNILSLADISEIDVAPNEISAWWQRVRNLCSQSENIRAAYMAVLVCRAVAIHALMVQSKTKDPDADTASIKSDEASSTNESLAGTGAGTADLNIDVQDWVSLTVDLEQWELLVRQLEDVMALVTLLNIPAGDDSTTPIFQPLTVSLNRLLNGGKGSIPEVVARYIVQQNLNPASLFYTFSTQDETISGIDDSGESNAEDIGDTEIAEDDHKKKDLECIEKKAEKKGLDILTSEKVQEMSHADRVKSQLEDLRRRFPHSLNNDILLANCCWEYAVVWNKDPEVTSNLDMSFEFLRLVQNAVLRQGVSSLLWHMFMKKRASAAAHLMEKVGKPPKDRLCRKDVGVSDSALVIFVSLCADFMEILMDANCEANEVPVCNMEFGWQKIEGTTSLMELAVDQKATNYGLLRVHYHLLKIMSAVLSLGMKSVKVLSLFDNKGRGAVFRELHEHPLLPNQKVQPELIVARKNFLNRVISCAVATIDPPAPVSTASSPSQSSGSSLYKRQKSMYPTAFKWPQVVQMLARDFGLDLDMFKRHHVCELYSFGHDKLAEEVMMTVNDHEELGVQLLIVAGQRVAYEIFKRDIDANFQHLAGMSTALTRWLKNLDPNALRYPTVPLPATVALIEQAATRLIEDSNYHELAQELLEKTRTLSAYQSG